MTAVLTRNVTLAAELLKNGRLVAIPTETVYGLGADALNPLAVSQIFAAKQRPHFDPLIVHVAEISTLSTLVKSVPETARKLIESFWPGPLTLVLEKQDCVPDLVTAGLPDVAVRMPSHPLALSVIREAGVPIAAPSANLFGRISPTTAEHVLEQLGDEIQAVLDGGPCSIGLESTVLKCHSDGTVQLLRPGGLSTEEIESVIGSKLQTAPSVIDSHQPQVAPGMLAQHYAPQKPLYIVTSFDEIIPDTDTGILSLQDIQNADQYGHVERLSRSGDLNEAAAQFFAALRRLDSSAVTKIYATPFPEHGLGRALNDRLLRASTR